MEQYLCNSTEHKFWLSYICTNGSDVQGYECYNTDYIQNPRANIIRKGLGVWLTLVGVFGGLGNLYTLISIPFAAKRNKFGLNANYRNNTVFVLHLCFVDFCCCVFYVLPHGIIHLEEGWPFPPLFGCAFIVFMGNTTVVADMLALAFVALARGLTTIFPHQWGVICNGKRNLGLIFSCIWILSAITNIPHAFKRGGVELGWDCSVGGCGYRTTCMTYGNDTLPRLVDDPEIICDSIFYGNGSALYLYTWVLYSISIVIIIGSYLAIFWKIEKTKENVDKMMTCGSLDRQPSSCASLAATERKMTYTVLILILLNMVCWLPYQLFNLVYIEGVVKFGPSFERYYYDLFVGLYFTQYALNFFVYVVNSGQYRKSFSYFFIQNKHETLESISKIWE